MPLDFSCCYSKTCVLTELHTCLCFFTFIRGNRNSKRHLSWCSAPRGRGVLPSVQDCPSPGLQTQFPNSIISTLIYPCSPTLPTFNLLVVAVSFSHGNAHKYLPWTKILKDFSLDPKTVTPQPSLFPFQSSILEDLIFSNFTSPLLLLIHHIPASASHSKSPVTCSDQTELSFSVLIFQNVSVYLIILTLIYSLTMLLTSAFICSTTIHWAHALNQKLCYVLGTLCLKRNKASASLRWDFLERGRDNKHINKWTEYCMLSFMLEIGMVTI